MRNHERRVAKLVEAVLPGSLMRAVPSQSDGEWDFDLVTNGVAYAVEVTRATNQTMESLYSAILDEKGDGPYVERKIARRCWRISASHATDVRALRRYADVLLAHIEAEDHTEFDISDEGEPSPGVSAIWQRLHVTDGLQLTQEGATHHEILLPTDQATLGSDQVVAVVEREANKSDNRRKLAAAGTVERHLFVQIDHLGYPAKEAMRVCGLPSRPVALPNEITHVWVSSHVGSGNTYPVWRFDRTLGWQDVGPIDLDEIQVKDA